MIHLVPVLTQITFPVFISARARLFIFDSFGILSHSALVVYLPPRKLSLPTHHTT